MEDKKSNFNDIKDSHIVLIAAGIHREKRRLVIHGEGLYYILFNDIIEFADLWRYRVVSGVGIHIMIGGKNADQIFAWTGTPAGKSGETGHRDFVQYGASCADPE